MLSKWIKKKNMGGIDKKTKNTRSEGFKGHTVYQNKKQDISISPQICPAILLEYIPLSDEKDK